MNLFKKILKELNSAATKEETLFRFLSQYGFTYTLESRKRKGIKIYRAKDAYDNFIEVVFVKDNETLLSYSFNASKKCLSLHTSPYINSYTISSDHSAQKNYLDIYRDYLLLNDPYNHLIKRDMEKIIKDSFVINKRFSEKYKNSGIFLDFMNIRDIFFDDILKKPNIGSLTEYQKLNIVKKSLKSVSKLFKAESLLLTSKYSNISLFEGRVYTQLIFMHLNEYVTYTFKEGLLFFFENVFPALLKVLENKDTEKYNIKQKDFWKYSDVYLIKKNNRTGKNVVSDRDIDKEEMENYFKKLKNSLSSNIVDTDKVIDKIIENLSVDHTNILWKQAPNFNF